MSELQAATSGRGHRPTKTSQYTKRKAADNITEASDTDSEFGRMDVDQVRSQVDIDEDGRETPQPLEDETETEDEDEGMVSASPPKNHRENEKHGQRMESKSDLPNLTHSGPPPRRDLPFARRAAARTSSAPPLDQPATSAERPDETSGETDDDEL